MGCVYLDQLCREDCLFGFPYLKGSAFLCLSKREDLCASASCPTVSTPLRGAPPHERVIVWDPLYYGVCMEPPYPNRTEGQNPVKILPLPSPSFDISGNDSCPRLTECVGFFIESRIGNCCLHNFILKINSFACNTTVDNIIYLHI